DQHLYPWKELQEILDKIQFIPLDFDEEVTVVARMFNDICTLKKNKLTLDTQMVELKVACTNK
ncbi:unnamed protein product, partial [Sphenostylis stenocarpa]